MFGMQPMHWLIVGLVVLLIYGPKRLPEMAKGLGEGLKEFKKVLHQEEEPPETPPADRKPDPEETTGQAGSTKR